MNTCQKPCPAATPVPETTLASTVRAALGRMDTTLTLCEAKAELTRHLIAWRKSADLVDCAAVKRLCRAHA